MQLLRRPSVIPITIRPMSFCSGPAQSSLQFPAQRFIEHCRCLWKAAFSKSWISAKIKCSTIPTILITLDTAISSVWIATALSNLKTETLIHWKIVSPNAWAFRPPKSSPVSRRLVMSSSAVALALTVICNLLRRANLAAFVSHRVFCFHPGSLSGIPRRPRFYS